MTRQPRQPMLLGHARQGGDHGRRQRPRAADIDVETAIRRGDLDIQRFCRRLQDLGQRPRGVQRAVQAGIEDRAGVDRDNGVAAGGGEADAQFAVAAAARMRGDAAPARAMGVDEIIDRTFDMGVRERIDHDSALPCPIRARLPVLDGAAAAGAKIRAERRDPLSARGVDTQQDPAIGMIGDRTGFDGFAAERVGHEHGVSAGKCHAVAAMADVIDDRRSATARADEEFDIAVAARDR